MCKTEHTNNADDNVLLMYNCRRLLGAEISYSKNRAHITRNYEHERRGIRRHTESLFSVPQTAVAFVFEIRVLLFVIDNHIYIRIYTLQRTLVPVTSNIQKF